ncbi:hypothetical protein PV10_03728 [Exophiala mesophila]|uniref:Uncharacterized protein n=1 Tax=Exophiala mesophila TaxID=212818 RepID=A0A0D2A058_EXOME|nr:uncharacterized protein PV10_03728 [Exophiala mesophila]KIV92428.1 hypothetical protein PV10_03728 [Exophiala mesophila]
MKFTLLLTCLSISGTFAIPLNKEAKPEKASHNLKLPHQAADHAAAPPVDNTLGGVHLNHNHPGSPSFQEAKSEEPFHHLKLPRQPVDNTASPPVDNSLGGVHLNHDHHDHLGSPSFQEAKPEEPFHHLKLPRQPVDNTASPPVDSTLGGVHLNHNHLGSRSPSFHKAVGTFLHNHEGQPNVTAELKHKFFKAMDSFISKHGHNRTNLEENIRNMKLHHNTTSFLYHGGANMSHLAAVMAEWAHLNPNNHGEDSKHDAAHDA